MHSPYPVRRKARVGFVGTSGGGQEANSIP